MNDLWLQQGDATHTNKEKMNLLKKGVACKNIRLKSAGLIFVGLLGEIRFST